MTDNLVLEHLKHIKKAVDRNTADMLDLKMRMSSVERSIALLHLDLAQINYRLDQVESRLDLKE